MHCGMMRLFGKVSDTVKRLHGYKLVGEPVDLVIGGRIKRVFEIAVYSVMILVCCAKT